MNDTAERLRQGVDPDDIQETEAAMDKGADEIERLRDLQIGFEVACDELRKTSEDLRETKAEVERLRAALREIAEGFPEHHGNVWCRTRVLAALGFTGTALEGK